MNADEILANLRDSFIREVARRGNAKNSALAHSFNSSICCENENSLKEVRVHFHEQLWERGRKTNIFVSHLFCVSNLCP